MIGSTLARALAAAHAAAEPVFSTEVGGQRPEGWWYFPPSSAVVAQARKLLTAHGLDIIFAGAKFGPKGQVCSEWTVLHVESGESMTVPWEAPPFADSETPTHGVLGAVRHAQRAIYLLVLALPVEKAPPRDRGVLGHPAVARPAPGSFVPPPGVPPEDIELPEWGQVAADAHVPEDRDADAAALGQVVDAPSDAVLWAAVTTWRKEHGATYEKLREQAGISAGPLTPEGKAALWRFLKPPTRLK